MISKLDDRRYLICSVFTRLNEHLSVTYYSGGDFLTILVYGCEEGISLFTICRLSELLFSQIFVY